MVVGKHKVAAEGPTRTRPERRARLLSLAREGGRRGCERPTDACSGWELGTSANRESGKTPFGNEPLYLFIRI